MQFYSDPTRESDPHALPDCEVFQLTATPFMKTPLFRAKWKLNGETFEGTPDEREAIAKSEAINAVRAGASFACILRDSQGEDHPDNAGKFFLHRFVKA